jgi:hypothetical protein
MTRWPWLMLASGVCGFGGSVLHPSGDPMLTGVAGLASWIGDALWIPSHALILASAALAVPALFGLAKSLTGKARTVAWIAFGASLVWLAESVPHLLAGTEADAVLAGEPTPFTDGHLLGAVIAYPLIGFSLAALAVLGWRALAHPVANALGALGSAAFGFAPIATGPLGIEALGSLFAGSMLMTAWLAVVGATALIRARRGA